VKHLEQGQTVLVRLQGSAAVAARVDAVRADEAALILLTPPLRPPAKGQAASSDVYLPNTAINVVSTQCQ